MKPPVMDLSLFLLVTFHAILVPFLSLSLSGHASAAIIGNVTDKLALLEFKSWLTEDPAGVLDSWNDSLDLCRWTGVKCGLKHRRITVLDLEGKELVGTISPHIGNLSFLKILNLANNSFFGGIPSELGDLIRLQTLNLSSNFLGGDIPVNLSRCSNLINLALNHNLLEREIPPELESLSKLANLNLGDNNLIGRFPASLGNLSSLQQLFLSSNNLEGEIPDAVAQMRSLMIFRVGMNKFSGVFPSSLYNLSSLSHISLALNNFSGGLRTDIGLALPNLQNLYLGMNRFSGHIPSSLANNSDLMRLDFPFNNFTGNIPMSFGILQNLWWLNLPNNILGSSAVDDLSFLTSLANCSKLQILDFSRNQFGGQLSASVANLSTQLTWLNIQRNHIRGSIPPEIANLINLDAVGMGQNLLTGNIPASFGKLSKLQELHIDRNLLTGEIPTSFGNVTQLLYLYMQNNSLEGSIPSSFGNCKYLQYLDLSHNKFSGTIPIQLVGISAFSRGLNLSHNSLTGSLPVEVENMRILTVLDVSYNKLSGEIPSELGSCLALEQLYMQSNFFRGTIPHLSNLRSLRYLDISNNSLDGQIPSYLVNISSLLNLNLSYNNLEGEVPVGGVFKNASAVEVYGNKNLCGGTPEMHLDPCPVHPEKLKKHIATKLILGITIPISCLALILLLFSLYWIRNSRKTTLSTFSLGPFYPKISYAELCNATSGFSSDNVIGSGNFGTVYKGTLGLGDETVVAVKVLNLQQRGASKSFMAECQALRNVRHRNLVKVLTACSSIDFVGNDFKALVYQFMPNGSLEKWLHPEDGQSQTRNLNFLQRVNIAIDVASALHYLHHQCQNAVIHCDLKPSNVLLDNDRTAHVSDFGLARLLSKFNKEANLNQFSSLGIKGTIGYAAPEYGMGGKVSPEGDLYSYGILLLEMFTGRRPTDEPFKDNFNLHNFVKHSLPDQVMGIVDQSALHKESVGKAINNSSCWNDIRSEQLECLISVFQIGVACSAEVPQNRMDTQQILRELLSVRVKYLGI
ncbi:unnamed protein product [Camellia sinensis]